MRRSVSNPNESIAGRKALIVYSGEPGTGESWVTWPLQQKVKDYCRFKYICVYKKMCISVKFRIFSPAISKVTNKCVFPDLNTSKYVVFLKYFLRRCTVMWYSGSSSHTYPVLTYLIFCTDVRWCDIQGQVRIHIQFWPILYLSLWYSGSRTHTYPVLTYLIFKCVIFRVKYTYISSFDLSYI